MADETHDSDEMQERLDDVQRDIDRAERRAQEHGSLHDPDEPTVIDPDADGVHEGGPLDQPGTQGDTVK